MDDVTVTPVGEPKRSPVLKLVFYFLGLFLFGQLVMLVFRALEGNSALANLAKLRSGHEALRRGEQRLRNFGEAPGLLAVSRFDPQTGREIVIAFNTSTWPLEANVEIDPRTAAFQSLHGECAKPWAPGSMRVALEPLGYVICAAK